MMSKPNNNCGSCPFYLAYGESTDNEQILTHCQKCHITEPASVEDLMVYGVCDECDQDPATCHLNDYCAYGHTVEVLQ